MRGVCHEEVVEQLFGRLDLGDQRVGEQREERGLAIAGDCRLGGEPLVGGNGADEPARSPGAMPGRRPALHPNG